MGFLTEVCKLTMYVMALECHGIVLEFITNDREELRLPLWIVVIGLLSTFFNFFGELIEGFRWELFHTRAHKFAYLVKHMIFKKSITMQQGNSSANLTEGKLTSMQE